MYKQVHSPPWYKGGANETPQVPAVTSHDIIRPAILNFTIFSESHKTTKIQYNYLFFFLKNGTIAIFVNTCKMSRIMDTQLTYLRKG